MQIVLHFHIQITPVILPRKSHGQRNLVGYNIAHAVAEEPDTTEWLNNKKHKSQTIWTKN